MSHNIQPAYIFPGQGAQFVGMCRDFYDAYRSFRDVMHEVDDSLGEKLSKLIFNGAEEELSLTYNAQPAIMAVCIGIYRVFSEQNQNKYNCRIMAGHSLGQYTALCAAGSISLYDTARLLRARGEYMQDACPMGIGAMVAVIGVKRDIIDGIINDAVALSNKVVGGNILDIANDNHSSQIVLSGTVAAINCAIQLCESAGMRCVRLNVSAAFHSRLMEPACQKMQQALADTKILSPMIPVVDNITLLQESNVDAIRSNLVQQISHTVRWRETVDILKPNVNCIVELSPKKLLANIIKKDFHNVICINEVNCLINM